MLDKKEADRKSTQTVDTDNEPWSWDLWVFFVAGVFLLVFIHRSCYAWADGRWVNGLLVLSVAWMHLPRIWSRKAQRKSP